MNIKILKYNIYLMMTLYALVWGVGNKKEITKTIQGKTQNAVKLLETNHPLIYRTIASIVKEENTKDLQPILQNKKNSIKFKNERNNQNLISQSSKKNIENISETPAQSIARSSKLNSTLNFKRIEGLGNNIIANNSPTINKPIFQFNPVKNKIKKALDPNLESTEIDLAPMETNCAENQENVNNECVNLPQIQSVSDQSLKTINDLRIPLILSDERYTCDNLVFTYDSEYIASSDLTIIKEASDCFLRIKPSLNKSGNTAIGIRLNHNSRSIETLFNLELIALTSVQLEEFPSIIPKDLEFTPQITGTFSDSSTGEISSKIIWGSTNTYVIHNLSETVFQAKDVGVGNITGAIKEFTVDKNIEVQEWNNLFLSDYYVQGFLNAETQLKAFVFLTNGSTFDLTKYINWHSYQEEIVYVQKGNSKMQDVGIAQIDAFFGNQQKTAYINVQNKEIATVDIVGPSILTPWGQASYKVIANFNDSSNQDITSLVNLTVEDNSVASISNNVLLPLNLGTTTLQLMIGELNFEKQISIELNTLNSIQIRPANFLAYKNQKISYKVYGIYSDGQEFDLTNQANISISNTVLATISNNNLIVTNSTNSFGDATLSTTINGVFGSTKVYFNPATISTAYIHLDGKLSVGSNYQLKVLANLSDGGLADLTSLAKFSSSNDNVVSVSNSYYNLGKIYGMSLGNANIKAEVEGLTVIKNVIVDEINTIKDVGYGLTAEYYSGRTFTTYKGKRIDKNIDFNWSNNVKAPMGLTDAYSVRWTGKFKASATMNYRFCTDSDDGVRVWLNNALIIDSYVDHALKRDCSAAIALNKDQKVNIRVDFYENTGFAVIKLYSGPSTASQTIIPMENFFPE